MANETRYYDTNYTFISPVRHFKANDPYYYEIDNIPLKQLEESQNFLKDQVDGIITKQNNKKEIEIDRSNFSELKPFANGNDRKVRVKPGRYSSRINNAYSLTPLQIIEQIAGFSNTLNESGEVSKLNTWRIGTSQNTELQAVLDEFQDGLNGDALNMNGLAERSFVFPIDDEDGLSASDDLDFLNPNGPGYSQFDSELSPNQRPTYPNYIGSILQHTTNELSRDLTLIRNVFSNDVTEEKPNGSEQGTLESAFIKRWRGAIRTSIVDVPEELEISVPDFDLNDFYYFDSAGIKQPLNATQRIDLLFIYSKAVDEESTTIPKFDSAGQPQNLTKPQLGILKGAGIGLSRQLASNSEDAENRVNLQTLDGTPIMLAHPGDENSNNNGFATSSGGFIRGSFPSPDDLMNLAPVLSENLEATALPLIGQTILPVAYIRVQTNTGLIADILNDEDIIDIRPFFRTTELAYNERAGIAAATPQISMANPVVSEAHLEKVRTEVFGSLNDRVNSVEAALSDQGTTLASVAGPGNTCRPIAAGNVLGGFWGPEGALIKHARENTLGGIQNASMNQFVDLIEEEFGYPAGSVPYLPDWDKATWYGKGGFTGNEVCDSVNMSLAYAAEFNGPNNDVKFMPPWKANLINGLNDTVAEIRDEFGTERVGMYHWGENVNGMYSGARPSILAGTAGAESVFGTQTPNFTGDQLDSINRRNVQINFVRKRIRLDLTKTPWVSDYQVKVNLLHCAPLCDYTSPTPRGKNQGQGISSARNSCQVWVQKYSDYFVICVAWAGTNSFGKTANQFFPWNNRDNPEAFAGFVHPRMQLRSGGPFSTGDSVAFGQSVNYGNLAQRNDFFKQQVGDNHPAGTVRTQPEFFDSAVPLLYPSVQWEVVGVPSNFTQRSSGPTGTKMSQSDPIIECL